MGQICRGISCMQGNMMIGTSSGSTCCSNRVKVIEMRSITNEP